MSESNRELSAPASCLPMGWISASIADVVAPMETANPAKCGAGEFLYVDIEAVDNIANRIVSPKRLRRETPPSRARHVIRTNDVIISLVRPRLKNVAIVPPGLDAQWASTAFCVCRPRSGVDARYLHYMFVQDEFLQAIKTYGDSPPSGHDDDLFATIIPIAPAREQTRIADRVDELFTDLAAGVAALERVKRGLLRYRAAVLHAAVTGRLTAGWREQRRGAGAGAASGAASGAGAGALEESGAALLERILIERRTQWERRTLAKYEKEGKRGGPPKGWRERYVEPAGVKMVGDGVGLAAALPELPGGWCWASGGQLLSEIRSGSTVVPTDSPTARSVLRSSCVRPGSIDLNDTRFVPEDALIDEADYVRLNDLFFVRLSGSLHLAGACGLVQSEPPAQLVFPDRLFAVRVVLDPLSVWMSIVFQTGIARNRIEPMAMSTAGHQRISMGAIIEQSVPLPPLAEQSAIVEAVNEKLSQIDALEAEVERGLARASRLRQAILKAAFEGKLVEQDPADEPAGVLLERVRAEVAASERTSKPTARKPKTRKVGTQ